MDPSYLLRIEHGDREPPRQYIVEALARTLELSFADTNQLLLAAGYSPKTSWSPALAAVADVETSTGLTMTERDEFEHTILTICRLWKRGLDG